MWFRDVWCSQLLALFLLSTIVAARTLTEPLRYRHADSLFIRADDSDDCTFPCDDTSCGTTCTRAVRRDLSGLLAAPGYALQAYNSTGGYWYYHSDRTIIREILHKAHLKRSLDKRAFDKLSGRVTAQKVDDYVKNQLVGKPEPQFPNKPEGFFSGDMNTVSLLGQFGTDTIQFGTNQLHGCTMLTVISNRAVYMAHYWETYSTGGNDNIAGTDLAIWQQRVLDAIYGVAVNNPTNPTDPKFAYLPSQGPGINWGLFNQPGDNTQAFFMTPLADGVTDESSTQIKYPNKIGLVEDLLRQNIPGIRIARLGYNRLRYSVRNEVAYGQDAKLLDKSARGMCLFQYDGAGNWRLMYQAVMKSNYL